MPGVGHSALATWKIDVGSSHQPRTTSLHIKKTPARRICCGRLGQRCHTHAHWLARDCKDLRRKDTSQLSANHRRRHPKLSLSCTSLIDDALVAFRFRSQWCCCIDYVAHDLSAISCALTRGHVADQFLGAAHCETSRL